MPAAIARSGTASLRPKSKTNALRVLRVGLLGLGQVGQAVVRTIREQARLFRRRGLDVRVTVALVRDASRDRRGLSADLRLTDDAAEFLACDYDVAIEVLGGVEPANTLVTGLLSSGVPVVTANKSLLAAGGLRLRALARAHGSVLRREASVIAGVPLLQTLERRPLSSRVSALTGILNGTSNYVLSAMEENGSTLSLALQHAQDRGFAESDPSNDVRGIDSAEKLVVLLQELGVRGIGVNDIETVGIEGLTPVDLAQARLLGGRIKPIAHAKIERGRVRAFVGPAFLKEPNPLAHVAWQNNGIGLRCASGCELFHSGPGAGPDVTAATILDDLLEIASGSAPIDTATSFDPTGIDAEYRPPDTGWLLRIASPAAKPPAGELWSSLASAGVIRSSHLASLSQGGRRVLHSLVRPCPRERVCQAQARLKESFGCECEAWRVLEN